MKTADDELLGQAPGASSHESDTQTDQAIARQRAVALASTALATRSSPAALRENVASSSIGAPDSSPIDRDLLFLYVWAVLERAWGWHYGKGEGNLRRSDGGRETLGYVPDPGVTGA